jgi:hypothetical protein
MPVFAMARAVGLVGLPPHGDELIGDLCFLFVVLTVVGGGVWAGWRGGRDADGDDGGGQSGGDQGRDVHQYPLLQDD